MPRHLIETDLKMKLSLQNYEGATDLNYPLGVFSTTGTYLGIATNAAEYMALWNADANNQELGTITSGTGTVFDFFPKYINVVANLYALEYYTIQAYTNVVLHLDDGDIVVYNNGATIKKASDSPLVDSDTKREWNPDVQTPSVNWHVPQFFCREVTCTGYANNAIMNVFHSRTSKVFGSRLSFGQYTISGVLPTGLKYFYMCGQGSTDYNAVTNWNSLNKLEWFLTQHAGGGVWYLDDSKLPTLNTSSLKGVMFGEYLTNVFTKAKANLNAIAGQVKQIVFTQNGAVNFTNDSTLIDSLPPFSELLKINNGAATTSAAIDYAINTLGTLLTGIVPSGEAAIKITNSNVRTAASDTAYNALVAAGWTITLT